MTTMQPQSTDGIQTTVRTFVVRSAETGDIIHVHEELTFAHTPPSEERGEDRALRLLGEQGRNATAEEVEPGYRHPVTLPDGPSRA
ncbi:hypothetical protein A8W25_08145 [Streptomyces sp. ERV7]|nr:hypothetical protein A8W25_08145 [Streptomyces sp. ERV7]